MTMRTINPMPMIISRTLNNLENIWYETQKDGIAIHNQLYPCKNQSFTQNPIPKVINAVPTILNKILFIIIIQSHLFFILNY